MVNSSSLFHFTRDFETLMQILAEGLRFIYCYEPFGEIVAKKGLDIVLKVGAKIINCKGIVIPMICFCDIPLLRTQKHRENIHATIWNGSRIRAIRQLSIPQNDRSYII